MFQERERGPNSARIFLYQQLVSLGLNDDTFTKNNGKREDGFYVAMLARRNIEARIGQRTELALLPSRYCLYIKDVCIEKYHDCW